MAKKNSLGRGLDSLFIENTETKGDTVSMLRVSDIEPNPAQPRKHFDETALNELADSLQRHGLLQPIAVRESPSGFYQIIAGERRWRAAKLAGMTELPAIIYEMDDRKAAELALIENLQREDLNPVEEAIAFKSLIEQYGLTQEDAAQQVGKSRSAVANTLRLLELPEDILDDVANGLLTAGHARALLSLQNPADIAPLANRIESHGMSVRQAEAEAKAMNLIYEQSLRNREDEDDDHELVVPDVSSYMRSLEQRVSREMGRKFRISDSGDGKHRRIEIFCQNNQDIEYIIRRLCGEDFFDRDEN